MQQILDRQQAAAEQAIQRLGRTGGSPMVKAEDQIRRFHALTPDDLNNFASEFGPVEVVKYIQRIQKLKAMQGD